jgi:hypothetical protein
MGKYEQAFTIDVAAPPDQASGGESRPTRHVPGSFREDVSPLEERLEVREHGRPSRGRVIPPLVGKVLVRDREPDDPAVRLDLEGDPGRFFA